MFSDHARSANRENAKSSLSESAELSDAETIYQLLKKLGADVDKLKKLRLNEIQLAGIASGLLRLRDRRLAKFLTSLSAS